MPGFSLERGNKNETKNRLQKMLLEKWQMLKLPHVEKHALDVFEVCPVGALQRKKVLECNTSKCIGCGACVAACKHGALALK